jgi:hypothetical protein
MLFEAANFYACAKAAQGGLFKSTEATLLRFCLRSQALESEVRAILGQENLMHKYFI